ncbi:MAG: hypothetical protein J6W22_08455 [Fibrobacter sp.]|nr:hypothetical protein [Fibrobacter sp.]
MRFVIFSGKNNDYIPPLANGLYEQLIQMGHSVYLLNNGIYWLRSHSFIHLLIADLFHLKKNLKLKKKFFQYYFFSLLFFWVKHRKRILEADCLIVVCNCPQVFYKNNLRRIEWLRKRFDGPIVNYDLHYMPNQGWFKKIKKENKYNFGLERFDWYLPASLTMEFAIPRQLPKIYDCIGFNVKSDDLFPEQNDFIALLDFPRKGYEKERAVQKEALKKANVPYIELKGHYTRDEIRKLYRKCSLYFVSCRESFCLPVLETQLCGDIVFTPYEKWLPAHMLDKNLYEFGVTHLGRNFRVYHNNEDELVKLINVVKKDFSAKRNVENFKEDYPYYFAINEKNMISFVDRISNKTVTKNTHMDFLGLNDYLSMSDDVILY